jgi:WD40 repeat protein
MALVLINETYLGSCGWDRSIRVWDLNELRLVEMWEGHNDSVLALKYVEEKGYLVSASNDKTVKIWDISSL